MTERTWPLAGDTADASVSEQDWSTYFRSFVRAGVLGVPGDGVLRVSTTAGANREVSVAVGAGSIQGFSYRNDATKTLQLAANSSGVDRVDAVVLRYDPSQPITSRIRIVVSQGSPGGGRPVLTRNSSLGAIYEIVLAYVTVSNNASVIQASQLIDAREFSQANVIPYNGTQDIDLSRVPVGSLLTMVVPGGSPVNLYIRQTTGIEPVISFPELISTNPNLYATTGTLDYGAGGTHRGQYMIKDGWLDLTATFDFGSNPNGRQGPIRMDLPDTNSSPSWQYLDAVLFYPTNGNHYVGKFAVAPGSSVGDILMPKGDAPYTSNGTNVSRVIPYLAQMQNETGTADKPGGSDTSVPKISNGPSGPTFFPIIQGTRISISGRLRVG